MNLVTKLIQYDYESIFVIQDAPQMACWILRRSSGMDTPDQAFRRVLSFSRWHRLDENTKTPTG